MQPKQLELDLWQILALAQAEPQTADLQDLCKHLAGLDLIDGGKAIETIGEVFRSKAEALLAEIATAYLPQEEPIVSDELWAHLYQRIFILNDNHLFFESEHFYPESRQSVIKLGSEADKLVSEGLQKIEILGNAHSEDIPAWAARIKQVIAEFGEMSLLDLQKRSGLALVDLWLGLLLGDTGALLDRSSETTSEFYWQSGISVKNTRIYFD